MALSASDISRYQSLLEYKLRWGAASLDRDEQLFLCGSRGILDQGREANTLASQHTTERFPLQRCSPHPEVCQYHRGTSALPHHPIPHRTAPRQMRAAPSHRIRAHYRLGVIAATAQRPSIPDMTCTMAAIVSQDHCLLPAALRGLKPAGLLHG